MKKTSPLIFKIGFIAISAMLVFATNARAERGVLEWDIDRPGSDFANFALPGGNPFLCQELCLGAPPCLAWTYVIATGQCFLKTPVPAPVENACCISGKRGF
jgi:PAN domain